jgi:ribose 5-phosphate isomerase B
MLAFGERVVGAGLALDIVKTFLETEFSGAERHVRRIDKITAIEGKYFK